MPIVRIIQVWAFVALVMTAPFAARASEPVVESKQVVLHFPKNMNFGRFSVEQERFGQNPLTLFRANARGDVVANVPEGYVTMLDLSSEVFRSPGALEAIAGLPIDAIDTSFSAMDDGETAKAQKIFDILAHFRNLKELNVDRSDASDVSLAKFHDMPKLRFLSAFACAIDGDCLKSLATCPLIDTLSFWNCALKPASFRYFPEFKNLTHLCVNATNCGDASMQQIGRCQKLVWLLLASNSFSNEGLKSLANLKALNHLDISRNNINIAGVRYLKGPNLKVLVLPPTVGRKNHDELKRLFPGCNIVFTKDVNVSDEDKVLFGPIH